MVSGHLPSIIARDAGAADLSALTTVRQPEGLHLSRLRDAQRSDFRYFILLDDEAIVGFVCLVFRRPDTWLNANDTNHLPEINDLYIAEERRGHGYGSAAIRAMEHIVFEAGSKQLYISVEPVDNPRAYALYQRLGYQQIQPEPHHHTWSSTYGDGTMHSGELWLVDMVKSLNS